MKSYCNTCNRPTNQTVLKEVKIAYSEIEETGWWEETTYQIIQCGGCDEISFRKIYTDAQMSAYAEDHYPYSQELFPKRGPNSIPIKNFNNIPLNIKSLYRETIDAFNNEQVILCCAGIRAIIEGICKDKSVLGIIYKDDKGQERKKNNLEGKIESLAEKGYLTKDNSTSLHELRFLGNDALHELNKPSVKEIMLAIEIVELTIENIYEIQHKAQNLKNEIEARKKK